MISASLDAVIIIIHEEKTFNWEKDNFVSENSSERTL
jgi:hypothetical protein